MAGLARAGLTPVQRTFSGIQPTGALHLGNYLGAVRRWAGQEEGAGPGRERLYCVVDQHAITLPQPPAQLAANIRLMAASLLACGLNPSTCILFQQSRVAMHSELCWVLATLCTVPRLAQLTQYKDKAAKLKEIPLGLFLYPVLQAADILLYRATQVPVGEDNLQNLQIAQHLAQKFNTTFCSSPGESALFSRPEAQLPDPSAARLRSLRSPQHKMSKSDPDPQSCIYLTDSSDQIAKKIKSSVTDSTFELSLDPVGRPGVANLITIHSELTGQTAEQVTSRLQADGLNKVQLKAMVTETLVTHLTPIREELERLLAAPEHVDAVLEEGRNKAERIASETMFEVRRLVGWKG